jgi:hypothetical protein
VETLNGDLDKIHNWSEKWLVKFNPQNTSYSPTGGQFTQREPSMNS